MEPKRLKKNLPKILKSLKAEDRVLVVGTTKRPFDADLRPFCKVYKKIILIPRPDYASRFGKYIKSSWQNEISCLYENMLKKEHATGGIPLSGFCQNTI